MPPSSRYRPSLRHAELGDGFFDVVQPAEFPQHILRYRNQRWAARVGLDSADRRGVDRRISAASSRCPAASPQPLALRYHGHQFRAYNPDLGDGRGFLFAQLHDLGDGRLLDLGTKGSGRTPWSRGGDGRLTLKGGVREVLATAMLEALGVDTSKTFSLIETGEELERGDEPSPTRSSVLVRLSHSHIRIGTFQRLAYLEDQREPEPAARPCGRDLPARGLARATRRRGRWRSSERVCALVARTGAQWIARGLRPRRAQHRQHQHHRRELRLRPVALPADLRSRLHRRLFRPDRASTPSAASRTTLLWNLTRLAECLLPLAPQAELEAALDSFSRPSARRWRRPCWRGSGLRSGGAERGRRRWSRRCSTSSSETQAPFEQLLLRLARRRSRARAGRRAARRPTSTPARRSRPVRDGAGGARAGRRHALDHPYFAAARALHDADRRGRGAVGADRRRRRLGAARAPSSPQIEEMREAYSPRSDSPG